MKSYPVDAAYGWTVPLQGVTVNGQSIDLGVGKNGTRANVSTTSTLISGPREVVERIYALIPGAMLKPELGNPSNLSWVFPCENVPNISISLNIGGDEYSIAAVDTVVGVDHNNTHGDGWTIQSTPKTGSCVGLFRSM